MLVLLLATVAPANAQTQAMSFGIKGGVNYANMAIDQVGIPETDNFLRFGGGITLGTQIKPNLGFDVDVLYLLKGTTFEIPSLVGPLTFEYSFEYIVVSPMLRVAPGQDGAGIYFLGGPEFSYLIEATSHGSREGSETDWDISDNFKDLDVGLTIGMGFQTAGTGESSFFLEGRYAHGLTDIADANSNSEDLDAGDGVKTRGIYLFAGMRF